MSTTSGATQLINRRNAVLLDVREPRSSKAGDCRAQSTFRCDRSPGASPELAEVHRAPIVAYCDTDGEPDGRRRAREGRVQGDLYAGRGSPRGRRTACRWRSEVAAVVPTITMRTTATSSFRVRAERFRRQGRDGDCEDPRRPRPQRADRDDAAHRSPHRPPDLCRRRAWAATRIWSRSTTPAACPHAGGHNRLNRTGGGARFAPPVRVKSRVCPHSKRIGDFQQPPPRPTTRPSSRSTRSTSRICRSSARDRAVVQDDRGVAGRRSAFAPRRADRARHVRVCSPSR